MSPRPSALLALLAFVACLFAPLRAGAHDVQATTVTLEMGDHAAAADMVLPAEQLALAMGPAPGDLAAYLRAHLSARSKDGRPFEIEVGGIRREHVDDGDVVIAHATLRPPPGASARWIELRDDAIVHRVVTHDIYVFVRPDLAGDAPQPAGLIHWQQPTVTVDRAGEGGGGSSGLPLGWIGAGLLLVAALATTIRPRGIFAPVKLS